MEPIVSSETSASNTQTPGIYPKESEIHLQHGENLNLKSRNNNYNNHYENNINSYHDTEYAAESISTSWVLLKATRTVINIT
jgi:hypothetical protein